MNRVSLLLNQRRPAVWSLARRAIDCLRQNGLQPQVSAVVASALGEEALAVPDEEMSTADLIITLGGDGTILQAARLAWPHETPILGVNLGRFGFIATVQPGDLESAIRAFLNGEHMVEERMMVQSQTFRGAKQVNETYALNEIVIHRPVDAPMVNFGILIDDHRVTAYPADGIIVSTATGSTAYSLSAGGPIVEPTMEAMILNAISPHTLGARPFITRPQAVIKLVVESEAQAVVVADGQISFRIDPKETVVIRKADHCTRLVTFRPDDFYTKLGQRLLYGARVEE